MSSRPLYQRAGAALPKIAPWYSEEFRRIEALPTRKFGDVVDDEFVDAMTEYFRRPGGTMRLLPVQALTLYEAAKYDGAFCPLAVGSGKTLISILLPLAMESKNALLLVPKPLAAKTLREMEHDYRPHWRLPSPLRFRVMSYAKLSHPNSTAALRRDAPDLIICDEGHALSSTKSSRWRRFYRYLRENPETRLVIMSGGFAKKSITDYAHLMHLASGDLSPLPMEYQELQAWAGVLDADAEPDASPGALRKFCRDGEHVRAGYARRLRATPSVILSTASSSGLPVRLHRRQGPALPDAVTEMQTQLERTWRIGDDELWEALAVARYQKQLDCGFYYKWIWPDGEKDIPWIEARSDWHRELRGFLSRRAKEGLDSEALVRHAILEGRLPVKDSMTRSLSDACQVWAPLKPKYNPHPPVETVWIDHFFVDFAEEIFDNSPPRTIVWLPDHAVGAMTDELEARGHNVWGAGMDASLAKDPVIWCSIGSQGTGKNLQKMYHRNVVLYPLTASDRWQQLIGRTDRPGQPEPEIHVEWVDYTPRTAAAMEIAMNRAEFVEGHLDRQKILHAITE